MNLTLQEAILIIATLGTIIGVIRELRKGPSELEQRVTGSAVNLVDRYETRLKYVEGELDKLESSQATLTELLNKLKLENINLVAEQNEFKEKLSNLNNLLEKLKVENGRLKKGINILISQLRESGIEPKWTPKSDEVDWD